MSLTEHEKTNDFSYSKNHFLFVSAGIKRHLKAYRVAFSSDTSYPIKLNNSDTLSWITVVLSEGYGPIFKVIPLIFSCNQMQKRLWLLPDIFHKKSHHYIGGCLNWWCYLIFERKVSNRITPKSLKASSCVIEPNCSM